MGKRGPKPKVREMPWSPDFAYAVGLMASDGNLSKDGRHLSFISKDYEQVENLKECFGLNNKIESRYNAYMNNKNTYYRIQWGDVFLYQYLESIGFMPNKSLVTGILKIPDEHFFDFLRGDFDGDGCFYSYFDPRWKSSFMYYLNFVSASGEHINWIQATIEKMIGVSGHMTHCGGGNKIWNLRYAKSDTDLVLDNMYRDKSARTLSRKRLKIETALRIVGKSLPVD